MSRYFAIYIHGNTQYSRAEKEPKEELRSLVITVNKSNKKFKPITVSATVLVIVSRFDRSPLDLRHVVGEGLSISTDLYQIGMTAGIIANWLPRNVVEESSTRFEGDIPNITLGLRKIASWLSPTSGQGVKKCMCKTRCSK